MPEFLITVALVNSCPEVLNTLIGCKFVPYDYSYNSTVEEDMGVVTYPDNHPINYRKEEDLVIVRNPYLRQCDSSGGLGIFVDVARENGEIVSIMYHNRERNNYNLKGDHILKHSGYAHLPSFCNEGYCPVSCYLDNSKVTVLSKPFTKVIDDEIFGKKACSFVTVDFMGIKLNVLEEALQPC